MHNQEEASKAWEINDGEVVESTHVGCLLWIASIYYQWNECAISAVRCAIHLVAVSGRFYKDIANVSSSVEKDLRTHLKLESK